jgi:DNA polymerase-1
VPLHGNRSELFSIQICPKIGEAYFIRDIVENKQLVDMLENPNIRKYVHGGKAEYQSLKCVGVCYRGAYFDTMIAAYLLDPTKKQIGLKALSRELLGIEVKDYEKEFKEGKTFRDIYAADQEQAIQYACADADNTLRLAGIYKPRIDKDFKKLFYEIEMPTSIILAQMELNGVKIDQLLINQQLVDNQKLLDMAEMELISEGGKFI